MNPLHTAIAALREIASGRNAAGQKIDFAQDIAETAVADIDAALEAFERRQGPEVQLNPRAVHKGHIRATKAEHGKQRSS